MRIKNNIGGGLFLLINKLQPNNLHLPTQVGHNTDLTFISTGQLYLMI